MLATTVIIRRLHRAAGSGEIRLTYACTDEQRRSPTGHADMRIVMELCRHRNGQNN